MGEEQWKVIPGYEPYEVSTCGNVRRLMGSEYYYYNHYMVKGYPTVNLRINKKHKCEYIHRLVAIAFIDNPSGKPCINHIDNNPLNNHVNNLEWCTVNENLEWARIQGRDRSFGKERKKIRATNIQTGESFVFISTRGAQDKGFYNGRVSMCCNGLIDSYKGYRFEYVG